MALVVEHWVRPGSAGERGLFDLYVGVLLGGIVAWAIPAFIAEMQINWGEARPIRRLLKPFHDNEKPTLIVTAPLYPTSLTAFEKSVPAVLRETVQVIPHHGVPWVLAESDAQALAYVMALLAAAGRTKNLSIVRDDDSTVLADANLVCIGSPKSNLKAKLVNDSFKGLPLRFAWEDDRQVIRSRDGTSVWRSDDECDYAVLVKVPNEEDYTKSVLFLAGISHRGTAGAGYYLWKHWRDLEASTKGKPFGMVLKVRRDDYQCVEPETAPFFVEQS